MRQKWTFQQKFKQAGGDQQLQQKAAGLVSETLWRRVIDKGTKPVDLKNLSAFDASQIMFVVKEKSQGLSKKWVKVWPSSDLIEEKIQSDEIAAAEKLKQQTPELKKVSPVAEIDDDEDIELEIDE